MSVNSVNSVDFSSRTPAFKGNYKRTDKGNPYYHTNSAIKIGGVMAGLSAIDTAIGFFSPDFYGQNSKFKSIDKSLTLAGGLIGIAVHLGASAFIDHKRNQKAKETADLVKKVGTKNAVMQSDDIALSNKGRAYYDSNVGSKYGAWLGAGAGLLTGIMTYIGQLKLLNSKTPDEFKTVAKIGGALGAALVVGISTLGGWLLGKWSDSIANKDARKHA